MPAEHHHQPFHGAAPQRPHGCPPPRLREPQPRPDRKGRMRRVDRRASSVLVIRPSGERMRRISGSQSSSRVMGGVSASRRPGASRVDRGAPHSETEIQPRDFNGLQAGIQRLSRTGGWAAAGGQADAPAAAFPGRSGMRLRARGCGGQRAADFGAFADPASRHGECLPPVSESAETARMRMRVGRVSLKES